MSVREWRCKTGPPAAFYRVGGNSMEGVKDVQSGTVRSSAPGLHGGRDEHARGCPRAGAGRGQGVRSRQRTDVGGDEGGVPEGASRAQGDEATAQHGPLDRLRAVGAADRQCPPVVVCAEVGADRFHHVENPPSPELVRALRTLGTSVHGMLRAT